MANVKITGLAEEITATDAKLSISGNPTTGVASRITWLNVYNYIKSKLNIGEISGLQAALDLKAPLASPTFTGTVTTAALTATSLTSAAGNGISANISNNSAGFAPLVVTNAGVGNLATFGGTATVIDNDGDVTSKSFIKSGGTASQFLKADGSVDANTYLTSASGVSSITGTANQVIASAATGAVTLSLPQSIATTSTVRFGMMGIGLAPAVPFDVTASSSLASRIAQSNGFALKILSSGTGGYGLQVGDAADTDVFLRVNNTGTTFIKDPTTSAGTYDILTRNTSTGVVEKIASSAATSGTYTPTLTNGANVTSSTSAKAHYIRAGSEVFVRGTVLVTTTADNTNSIVSISLPITSNLANSDDVVGNANLSKSAGTVSGAQFGNGFIDADTTNDKATLTIQTFSGTAGSSITYSYSFSYTVL